MDLFRPAEACDLLEDALAELNDDDSELRQRVEAGLAMSAWMETETPRRASACWASIGITAGRAGRPRDLAQKAMATLMTGQPAEHVRAAARDALHDAGENDSHGTFEVALGALILAVAYTRC